MRPFFSVIVPTHNRPDFLRRSVESVVEQSFTNWELIIVDDGSEDTVVEQARQIAKQDERIRYYYQASSGPGAARLYGSQNAHGQFLCFLDDDDVFLAHHLATLYQGIIQHNGGGKYLYRSRMASQSPTGNKAELPGINAREDALLAYWKHPHNLLTYAIPREAFQQVPIDPNHHIIEDFAWLSKLLLHFSLYQLQEVTAILSTHENNRTNTLVAPKWLYERLATVKELYQIPQLRQRVPWSVYKHLLSHQAYHYARQNALAGARGNMWLGLKKGMIMARGYNLGELIKTLLFCVRYLF
ncbi:MAG: glycosyltransferase family 2 protein [Bacteroidota bacterium]